MKNTKMSSAQYQKNIKNLKGTFTIEGMNLSKESIANLQRIANGDVSYLEIVEKIKQKYLQRM